MARQDPDPPLSKPAGPALVTGASGFLGKRLIHRLLEEGREVRGLCRTRQPDLEGLGVHMRYGSLEDAAFARSACEGMETVFHAAAKVGIWGRRREFRAVNVHGAQAIVNGCRDFLVRKLVYTSTPSVVFTGGNLAAADESLPYGEGIPCEYAATKARAEKAVLAAHDLPPGHLKTVALRPHLVWGPGDPNLVPRLLRRARQGRLRVVGQGDNVVDLTYIDNAIDAHLLAEGALDRERDNPGGKAYFVTNDEPVKLWEWINQLLEELGAEPVEKRLSLKAAWRLGRGFELLWSALRLRREPPMTRFLACELAKDHWFDIAAAKRDLGYRPRVSMDEGRCRLVASLRGG